MPIGQRPTFAGAVRVGAGSESSGPTGAPEDAAEKSRAGDGSVPSPVPGIVPARHPHVWVRDTETPGREWPGLVIEQGRDESGAWLAHVVMVVTRAGDARTTVSGWVPAALIRPASAGDSPPGSRATA